MHSLTSYPFNHAEVMNDSFKIIDPMEEIFHFLLNLISHAEVRGGNLFLTSGNPDLKKTAAKTGFGFESPHAKHVVL